MSEYAALQTRLSVAALVLALAAALPCLASGLVHWAAAVMAGGVLSVINFLLLGREMASAFAPGARPHMRLALAYGVRFALTAAALGILYLSWDLPLAGLIGGTLSVQAVILGAGIGASLEEAITGRPGRLRLLLGFGGADPSGKD